MRKRSLVNKSPGNVRKKRVIEKKPDRRVQRTRQLLRDALTGLVLENGYENTTVQNILDRANLGRSTFYTHYRDKDELLVDGFEQLRLLFLKYDADIAAGKYPSGTHVYDPSLLFFKHAAAQHRIYKALIGNQGGAVVHAYLYKFCSQMIGSHLKHQASAGKKPLIPHEVLVHFVVSSFLGLLTWWLNHDMPYSPEQIDEMFKRLTYPGMYAALGRPVPQ
jgi:AcrR family transcriptional regulator